MSFLFTIIRVGSSPGDCLRGNLMEQATPDLIPTDD